MLARDLEGARVFMTYDRGELEFMTTSETHESWKAFLAFLIELYALEMDIPLLRFGSMTCRRRDLKRGFEPDSCYYVLNAPKISLGKTLDFTVDPPPDLALEIEVSRRLSNRRSIYAAFGVPELWTYDGEKLSVMHLRKNGTYELANSSLSFPHLPLPELERFLRLRGERTEHEVVRAFQKWLRELSRLS